MRLGMGIAVLLYCGGCFGSHGATGSDGDGDGDSSQAGDDSAGPAGDDVPAVRIDYPSSEFTTLLAVSGESAVGAHCSYLWDASYLCPNTYWHLPGAGYGVDFRCELSDENFTVRAREWHARDTGGEPIEIAMVVWDAGVAFSGDVIGFDFTTSTEGEWRFEYRVAPGSVCD